MKLRKARKPSLDRQKAEDLIRSLANFNGVDPDLAIAIAEVESHFDELAARYEINWKYGYNFQSFAKRVNISEETEIIFQSTSWGMMQVMGTKFRELGFRGNLLEVVRQPELGIRFGCMVIAQLMKRYSKLDDVIAAYNAGTPKIMADGRYYNQTYVNKVRGCFGGRKSVVVS